MLKYNIYMDTNKIKTYVAPRLVEQIGTSLVNKRNGIGKSFTMEKHKPVSCKFLKDLNEDYKKLQKNEQFNTEQVATSVRCSHIFRTLETMVECALEQNDEQILRDTVDKVGMYIIRSLR